MKPSETSLVESGPLRYLQSVPTGHASRQEPWPVLCFLHGYGEAAPLEIHRGVTRHGPLRPGSSPRAVDEFIIIAPQLPRAGDIWHTHADSVKQIVTLVQSELRGDFQRTYLSGFSFGGNGAFDLAVAQPNFWAALWPVDPTRVPSADPQRPIWLSIGEAARRGKQQFIQAAGLKPAASVPQGDRLYLDEGEDHVGSATSAYRDDRIYSWLLSMQLS